MDCYYYGEFGHLAHQCLKPKKDKYKKKNKEQDDSSDNEKSDKKAFKKKGGNKEYHKKKIGKAYIVGDWLTDNESSSGNSFGNKSDDEKVAAIAIDAPSPSSSPPSSSSTHLCLTAKGNRRYKVRMRVVRVNVNLSHFLMINLLSHPQNFNFGLCI